MFLQNNATAKHSFFRNLTIFIAVNGKAKNKISKKRVKF